MKVPIKSSKKAKISGAKDIYPIMREILLRENKLRRKQEYFWIMGLNNALRLEYIELIALGRINAVSVEPMDVFSMALQKKCKSIVLVHNHPSGTLKLSTADQTLTDSLMKVAKIMKINIQDHLIITEKGYLSFVNEGLL